MLKFLVFLVYQHGLHDIVTYKQLANYLLSIATYVVGITSYNNRPVRAWF